jgi:hypothetical protein
MDRDRTFIEALVPRDRADPTEIAQSCGVHVATVWRWSQRGVKLRGGCGRARLRMTRVGGRTFIQRDDLEDFFARINGEAPTDPPEQPKTRTRRRQAEIDRAKSELVGLGVKMESTGPPSSSS